MLVKLVRLIVCELLVEVGPAKKSGGMVVFACVIVAPVDGKCLFVVMVVFLFFFGGGGFKEIFEEGIGKGAVSFLQLCVKLFWVMLGFVGIPRDV